MSYQGPDRRKMSDDQIKRDRLLERIDANLTNLSSNVATHMEQDKLDFKALKDKSAWHDKVIYGCMGVIIFIELLVKVVK